MSLENLFRPITLALLLGIFGCGALLWPLPDLGFDLDTSTGIVRTVRPGSAADQSGLKLGDRIARIYGYPWEETSTRLLLVPLPWQPGTPTPVTVVRGGQTRHLVMHADVLAPWFQLKKALRLVMALICWVTGYLLGTSPRARSQQLRRAGWYWVLLGSLLGVYQLTYITSYVLTVGVLWVLCTVLAPATVALHFWYPSRPTTAVMQRRVEHVLLAAVLMAQLAAFALVGSSPSVVALYDRFHAIGPVVFLLSLALSVIILVRAYRSMEVAHIRRQIRLIGAACILAGCWWAMLLLLLRWDSSVLRSLLPSTVISFGTVLIPLAYLLGGLSVDLMRLDQIVRRALAHMLTAVVVLAVLAVGAESGLLVITPVLFILLVPAMYAPLYHRFHHMLIAGSGANGDYQILRRTSTLLGTSLQADELLRFLGDGILSTFHRPPLAIYHRVDQATSTLNCRFNHNLAAPPSLDTALLGALPSEATVVPASDVQQHLGQLPLDASAALLVFHPTVSLWGILHNQGGDVLALVLIGPRGDDDPYQPRDVAELEHVFGAAALALMNSASYDEQVESRRMIRELYRHAQQIEEQTAAEIAQEIHDEVVGVNLGLNREILESLLTSVKDAQLQAQLQVVLEGEEATSQSLRYICEQLKPSGVNHPLGLAASLRQQTDRVRSSWRGQVTMEVVNVAVPVDEQIHRALVRITREALTNAVKHAGGTLIAVKLRFPTHRDDVLVLTVCDNGQAVHEPITPRVGHWGVRNMQEYADAIGGVICWRHPTSGGTCVEVTVPGAALSVETVVGLLTETLSPLALVASETGSAQTGS